MTPACPAEGVTSAFGFSVKGVDMLTSISVVRTKRALVHRLRHLLVHRSLTEPRTRLATAPSSFVFKDAAFTWSLPSNNASIPCFATSSDSRSFLPDERRCCPRQRGERTPYLSVPVAAR